jgi:hypothetical protein
MKMNTRIFEVCQERKFQKKNTLHQNVHGFQIVNIFLFFFLFFCCFYGFLLFSVDPLYLQQFTGPPAWRVLRERLLFLGGVLDEFGRWHGLVGYRRERFREFGRHGHLCRDRGQFGREGVGNAVCVIIFDRVPRNREFRDDNLVVSGSRRGKHFIPSNHDDKYKRGNQQIPVKFLHYENSNFMQENIFLVDFSLDMVRILRQLL